MNMTRRILAAVLICVCASLGIVEARGVSGSPAAKPTEVSNTLAKLPLSFEPNYGQSGCEVKFQSRAPGYLLQLTATEMRMIVRGSSPDPRGPKAPAREATSSEGSAVAHALRFTWLGANARAETSTEAALPGTVNYLKGSDSSKWRTSIPTFERVRYQEMYPGIDLLYYGNGRQLEYDLIVAPGADPDVIRLSIEGAETVLTKTGDLDLILSDGRTLQLRAPVLYQERGGEKLPIEGKYRLAHRQGRSEIAFDIAAYDPALPLVIDPLVYSTFLGGSGGDSGYAIAVNAANEAFVTGYTRDDVIDFPTTAGAFDTTHNGVVRDGFLTRLTTDGITSAALAVDGNGVLEAGEIAALTPSWRNDSGVTLNIVGNLSSFTGPGTSVYTIVDGAGSYGSVAPGDTAAASDNYSVSVSVPATRPSVHWDATFVETPSTTPPVAVSAKIWTLHVGNSFTDVATSYPFYRQIETLLHNNVTLGCGDGTQYCKDNPTPRISMAVFIARAELGSDAAVPVSGMIGANSYICSVGGNSLYTDVAPTNQFCKHVHYIASQNITSGCTPTTFCPAQNVTRIQTAIFLARALAGSDGAVPVAYSDPVTLRSYDLPNNSRAFTDLVNNTFEKHANYLWARGITDGCTGTTFCPSNLLTRGQMAKFLVGTYNMLLYKP